MRQFLTLMMITNHTKCCKKVQIVYIVLLLLQKRVHTKSCQKCQSNALKDKYVHT